MPNRLNVTAVLLGLVVLTSACGSRVGKDGWAMTRTQKVEAFGRDTVVKASISVWADSGPQEVSAELSWLCQKPSDPSTRPMVLVTRRMDASDADDRILVRMR